METYDKKAAELIERSYQTPEIVNQRLRTLAALALVRGESVLDAGCGTGLLLEQEARTVGSEGRAEGVDFSEAMLARARHAAVEEGATNIEFVRTDAEDLPLEDDSMDVALVNGIFNLNPDRESIFRELARVLRPEGVLYAAELILRGPVTPPDGSSDSNWFA